MPRHRKPPNRRATAAAAAVVVVVAVFAAIIGFGGSAKSPSSSADAAARSNAPVSPAPSSASSPPPSAPASTAASTKPVTPAPTRSTTTPPKPRSSSTGIGTQDASIGSLDLKVRNQPVRIRIPSLGVNAGIIPVGVDATGALQVPSNVIQAAWYQAGAAPGDPGTAIIAAHVDFNGALGLFNKLHTLQRGAEIDVIDANGKLHVFRATTGTLAPKSDPSTVQSLASTSAVKGRARLALITCGGDLDTVKHSYYDNYVLLADS